MLILEKISKIYRMGEVMVTALSQIDLSVGKGEYVAIMGPSGSGKSTLMNIIGCLDRPSSGNYFLAGENVSRLNDRQLARVRNRQVGFVFQSFNLLPRLNAVKNVELPLLYRGLPFRVRKFRAVKALEATGLADRLYHRPAELSGGQQQRVAIARALAAEPAVILADEPTGALDSSSGREILRLFRSLHKEGKTIILITHDASVAEEAERVIHLRDGRLESDSPGGKAGKGNPV